MGSTIRGREQGTLEMNVSECAFRPPLIRAVSRRETLGARFVAFRQTTEVRTT